VVDDPVLAAADGYSYLHLLIVAGIITFAVGARVLVRHVDASLPDAPRLALCGGVALYLVGHVGFRWRLTGELERQKLAVAAAILVVYAVGSGLAGWVLAATVAALLAALCAVETGVGPERGLFGGRQDGKHEAGEDSVQPLVK
jgi:low temperature requirement protein LtrA